MNVSPDVIGYSMLCLVALGTLGPFVYLGLYLALRRNK